MGVFAGENAVIVGGGLVTLMLKPAEPPPGGGFDTKPPSVSGSVVREAGRLNMMVLPLTVPRTPAKLATVDSLKPVPVTVTVVVPDPLSISAGPTLETTGGGFGLSLTVNFRGCVNPPPGVGFLTLTSFSPADNSFAGIIAVIDVRVVDCGEYELEPKLMIDVPLKLFPLNVKVNEPVPKPISVGEMLTNTGVTFCAKIRVADGSAGGGESPPPGGGLKTPIVNCSGVTKAKTPPFSLSDEMLRTCKTSSTFEADIWAFNSVPEV